MEKGKKTLRLPIMLCLLFLAGFIVWTWLSSRNSAYNFVGFLFGEGCLILFFLGGVFWTERKGMPAYALLCGVTILLTLGNAYQAIFSANGSIKGYPLFLAAALGLAIASYFFFCGPDRVVVQTDVRLGCCGTAAERCFWQRKRRFPPKSALDPHRWDLNPAHGVY